MTLFKDMHWRDWVAAGLESAAAIVLSIAALLTSWASFQAALWDGEQAASYTQASAARVEAGVLATERGQEEGVDAFLFSQWLNAMALNETRLQAFYRARFRPEFDKAFTKWLALDPAHNRAAPTTPFAMPEYRLLSAQKSRQLSARADTLFESGQYANEISDKFVQGTVVLALALFLGGIGQTFRRPVLRVLLTSLGGAACVFGAIKLSVLPALVL